MLQGLSPARGGHRPGLVARKGSGNFALAVHFIYLFGTGFLCLFAGRVGIGVCWRVSIDFFFLIYFILLLLWVRVVRDSNNEALSLNG